MTSAPTDPPAERRKRRPAARGRRAHRGTPRRGPGRRARVRRPDQRRARSAARSSPSTGAPGRTRSGTSALAAGAARAPGRVPRRCARPRTSPRRLGFAVWGVVVTAQAADRLVAHPGHGRAGAPGRRERAAERPPADPQAGQETRKARGTILALCLAGLAAAVRGHGRVRAVVGVGARRPSRCSCCSRWPGARRARRSRRRPSCPRRCSRRTRTSSPGRSARWASPRSTGRSRDGRAGRFPSPVREDGPGWRAEVDLPYGVTAAHGHRAARAARLRAAPPARRGVARAGHPRARRAPRAVGRPRRHLQGQARRRGRCCAPAQADVFQPAAVRHRRPRPRRQGAADLPQLADRRHPAAGQDGRRPGPGLRRRPGPARRDVDARAEGLRRPGPARAGRATGSSPASTTSRSRYAAESLKLLRAEIEPPHRAAQGAGPRGCARTSGSPARSRTKRQPEAVAARVRRSTRPEPVRATRSTASRPARTPSSSSRSARRSACILILATQRPDKPSRCRPACQRQRRPAVLPQGDGPDRNDMMLGTSAYKNGIRATTFRPEIDAGHRLPGRRQLAAAGRPHLLPGHARHRAGRQAGPGAARGRGHAVRRRARRGRHRAAARRPGRRRRGRSRGATGMHWQALADRLAAAVPRAVGRARPATRCGPSSAPAACRPWSS